MGIKPITPSEIRRIVLDEAKRAHVGHIASALSIVEIIAVLYTDILRIPSPSAPERDRFVLSKGHAALALYAALALRGFITRETLATYCDDDSMLGVHPEHELAGVDFTTGSLGHGLSFAVGSALAARLEGSKRRVYALLSDAECNEGSVWEAASFAAHHQLSNLTAIIDCNGQQALGMTAEILRMEPLVDRWQAFGWHAVATNGHDTDAIREAFAESTTRDTPCVIVAHTLAGKGVSFMERQVAWHYLPMTDEQHRAAIAEISGNQ